MKGIFLKSVLGQLINSGNFNIPPPSVLPSTDIELPNVILGDEAFALTKSMMKPYPRNRARRHSRARRTTENCFGIMASYFRFFFTPIHTLPGKIDKIILASCILHNMMRDEKIPSPTEPTFGNTDGIAMPTDNLIRLTNTMGRPTSEGTAIREKLKDYFNGIGAVPWQQNMFR